MRTRQVLVTTMLLAAVPVVAAARADALGPTALPGAVGGVHANVLAVDRSGRTVVVSGTVDGSTGAVRIDRLTGATVSLPPFQAVSADGSAVITVDNRWLDIASGTAVAVPGTSVTSFAFTADGRTYAAGGPIGAAGQIVTGATQARVAIPVVGVPERISPNGQFVLVATACTAVTGSTRCDYTRWDRSTGFTEAVVRTAANETLVAGVADNGRVVVATTAAATTTYVVKQAGLRDRTLSAAQTGGFFVPGGKLSDDGSTYGWTYAPTSCCGAFGVAHLDDASLPPDEVNFWTQSLNPTTPIGVLPSTTRLSGDGSQVVYLAITPPTTYLIGKAVPHTTPAPRLRAGDVLTVPVAGKVGVGAGATAVVVNATVTNPAGPGFLTLWPCGQVRPGTSTLNFVAGGTVANAAVSAVGTDGAVCVSTSVDADVVIDAGGWFTSGSFTPAGPTRLLDTRNGESDSVGNLPAGQQAVVPVAGHAGVAADARAAVLNLTVTNPGAAGFATVWPCGQDRPLASNVNFVAGQTVAASAIAAIGANGAVCISSNATLDVVVDVAGALGPSSQYTPRVPTRVIDTRNGQDDTIANVAATSLVTIPVPAGNEAVVVNATVTNPSADGFLVVWPCGEAVPTASTVNFAKGQTAANAAVVAVGAGSAVCARSNVAVDVVADLQGVFPNGSPFEPMQPARVIDTRG